jgi:hypothetical protein
MNRRKQWIELQSIEDSGDRILFKTLSQGYVYYTTEKRPTKQRLYARTNVIYQTTYDTFTTGFDLARQIHSFNFKNDPFCSMGQIFYSDPESDSETDLNQGIQTQKSSIQEFRYSSRVKSLSPLGVVDRYTQLEQKCQCFAVKFRAPCEQCKIKQSLKARSSDTTTNAQISAIKVSPNYRTALDRQRKAKRIFGRYWNNYQSKDDASK